jgi:hypothetical protein
MFSMAGKDDFCGEKEAERRNSESFGVADKERVSNPKGWERHDERFKKCLILIFLQKVDSLTVGRIKLEIECNTTRFWNGNADFCAQLRMDGKKTNQYGCDRNGLKKR